MTYLIAFINDSGVSTTLVEASCGDEAMDEFEQDNPEAVIESVERYSV